MTDLERALLVSIPTALFTSGAAALFGLWRDQLQHKRQLRDAQRARFVVLLQPLTETLTTAQRAAYEYETGTGPDYDHHAVLRECAVKLDQARAMGLPLEVQQPIDAAFMVLYLPTDEDYPDSFVHAAPTALQPAIEAVAKYLRES